MDLLTFIFLFAAANSTLLALALFNTAKKANFFLGGLVIILTVSLLHNVVLWDIGYYDPQSYPILAMFYSFLFIAPFFYFFIFFFTNPNRVWKHQYWWFFVPGLFMVCIINFHIFLGKFTGIWILPTFVIDGLSSLEKPLGLIMAIACIWPVWNLLSTHQQELKELYSDLEKMSLDWLKKSILIGGIACALCLIVFFFERATSAFDLPKEAYQLIWLVQSIILFVIGFKVFTYPSELKGDHFPVWKNKKGSKEKAITDQSFPQTNHKEALQKLSSIIESDKRYQQPKLTLHTLSRELSLSPRYLSYLIHTYYDCTFHDFINQYRVKEAIHKMKDPSFENHSLMAIAFAVGFNSGPAFQYSFKKQTGISPNVYRANLTSPIQETKSVIQV